MAQPNFYSNPAFCQQSEYYNGQPPPRALSPQQALSPQKALTPQRALSPQRAFSPQRALSPQRNIRQPPVGAQTPLRFLDTSLNENVDGEEYEQEFYEEMLVDDNGVIKEKKFLVVAQKNEGKKYIQIPQTEDKQGSRYGIPPAQNKIDTRNQNHRYEYIPMQENSRVPNQNIQQKPKKQIQEEQIALGPNRVHRYAVIETEEETELTTKNGRYALVPVEELNSVIPAPVSQGRYEYIQDSPTRKTVPNVVIQSSPKQITSYQPQGGRYEYIQPEQRVMQPQPQPRGNPIATQKLYELLSTPKKNPMGGNVQTPQKMLASQPLRHTVPAQLSPIHTDSYQTPPKNIQRGRITTPKAQQKLNYALGTRQIVQDKRQNTAIVAPMCSSPIQSVYSETTFSNKSESWMDLSSKGLGQTTLGIAAFMMLSCGGVTSGLCFYMISIMGRLYYLDLSVVAGFTCFILGLLGFRTRNVYWLPNRNYISGYILLSVFSLLNCTGLLALLFIQPKPGSPMADMTSGAVCGVSVFSLVLAVTGVFSSYCCKYPPPDNRVQHCAPGFTV